MPGELCGASRVVCTVLIAISQGPATDLGMRASLIERHSAPEILVHGLVTPDDVDKLFDM